MNKEDMMLISVDDHTVEPPDMFKNHLPKKYLDDAPRLVHNADGSDMWKFRDTVIPNVALNAVAGRPKEEYGIEPTGLDEIRPGCYNVDERVKDMNAGGILASICFPSFPGFAGRLFATDDHDFSIALVQAYNDWHIDEWCGAYPARFIPMAIPVIWDAEACAAEVRRVSKKGVHALTFTENPAAMGYPSFHDEYWNPLWKALCDTDTVMNMHIGSSGRLAITAPDAPMDVMITLQPMNIVQAAADLLWSRPIKEYPDLKIALSEGGTGWIPYFLERADRTYEMHSTWTHQDFGGKAAQRGLPRALPDLLHQRQGRRGAAQHDRHRQHLLGGRLPAQRLDVAGCARGAVGRAVAEQRSRRRDQQDDLRERHALVLVRPVHPHPARAGDGRRAAQGRRGARRVHQGGGPRQGQPRRRRPSRISRPTRKRLPATRTEAPPQRLRAGALTD